MTVPNRPTVAIGDRPVGLEAEVGDPAVAVAGDGPADLRSARAGPVAAGELPPREAGALVGFRTRRVPHGRAAVAGRDGIVAQESEQECERLAQRMDPVVEELDTLLRVGTSVNRPAQPDERPGPQAG
jgi:hypothetical protein